MPSLLTIYSLFLATSSTAITYAYFLHRSLSTRVIHDSHQGTLPHSVSTTIESIPPEAYSEEYFSIHDHATRYISRSLLPPKDPEELFTLLVRRNMTAFGKFPQAWIIRFLLVPPVERKTFGAAHIHSLQFHKGDLVCGVYRVEERTPNKVVFALLFEGPIDGRLVLSYSDHGDKIAFRTETAMWTKKGDQQKGTRRARMPLESPVPRFLHEMAAWWLLDSGVRYLEGLTGESSRVGK